MKMRIVFFICFVLSSAILVAAQARVVTNADLEKYREVRVKAEKDLRENYSRLGFPSPEERARRDAADEREREELSDRLRQQRIARERSAAEVEALTEQQARYDAYVRSLAASRQVQDNYSGYWGYGYGGRRVWIPRGPGIAWRADGSGVVYEPGGRSSNIYSPTVVRTEPRPVLVPIRHR